MTKKVENIFFSSYLHVYTKHTTLGTYISYLAYLYSQKKFHLANTVYNRACREVLDKDAFDLQVQKLKASYSTTL